MCSIAASAVFAVLAWTDRVPASVATSAYALELARYLPLAAIFANALVVLVAPRASRGIRAHTLAFRAT